MKPTSTPPIHPQPVTRPNGVHAFQRLSTARQRDEIAKGIVDFELRLAATTDLIQKLGKLT